MPRGSTRPRCGNWWRCTTPRRRRSRPRWRTTRPRPDAQPEPKATRGRGRKAEKTEAEPQVKTETPEQYAARRAEATKWIARAVDAGKAAFVSESAATGDEELEKLAAIVGPMARDRLGQSKLAFEIWNGAAQRIKTGPLKARCEVEAASIAINDLLDVAAARPLLEGAVAHLGSARPGAVLAALHRVRGDYFAATGDGKSARKEYADSEKVLTTSRTFVERNAWRGAHERSTEDYLKAHEFDRAAAEIRAWENEFPSEKVDGQVTLAYAAYWIGRQMDQQAVALGDQMLTVNPDSPYIDKMLLLVSHCQQRLGHTDRALEALKKLVRELPRQPPGGNGQGKDRRAGNRRAGQKTGRQAHRGGKIGTCSPTNASCNARASGSCESCCRLCPYTPNYFESALVRSSRLPPWPTRDGFPRSKFNRKAVASHSPGLPHRGYPGWRFG